MIDISLIATFLLVGAFVGVVAGLLGVGGGGILVPTLTYIFLYMGIPAEHVIHIALGTSMACIIVTSFSSLRAHNIKGAVNWEIVKVMSIGVIFGTFVATYVVSLLNSLYLALIFSCFMLWIAIKMISNKTPLTQPRELTFANLFCSANGIGAISALVSIGGGSLIVPYLIKNNIEFKKAIGTSAAIGLPISVTATLGYLVNGWNKEWVVANSLGFVYWPAVLCICITGFIFAPLGVKLAHNLPVKVLKVVFAVLLVILSIKMTFLVL